MRFYEFVSDMPIYDSELEHLKEWSVEHNRNFTESVDDEKVTEIKDFFKRYIIDPSSLTIGEKYFPIELVTRPFANLIEMTISNHPLTYLGDHDEKFIFKGEKLQIKVPIYKDLVSDFGPFLMLTTIYTTIAECEHFNMIFLMQFKGRWKIQQKEFLV
jgi:hypothetical protein